MPLVSGQAFNLGGGPKNAVSLLQLIAAIRKMTGQRIDLQFGPWRPNDQRYYVSDTRRLRNTLDLPRPLDWRTGVRTLVQSYTTSRMAIPEATRRVVA
jgi:CDP-paratose 2-epimerase